MNHFTRVTEEEKCFFLLKNASFYLQPFLVMELGNTEECQVSSTKKKLQKMLSISLERCIVLDQTHDMRKWQKFINSAKPNRRAE